MRFWVGILLIIAIVVLPSLWKQYQEWRDAPEAKAKLELSQEDSSKAMARARMSDQSELHAGPAIATAWCSDCRDVESMLRENSINYRWDYIERSSGEWRSFGNAQGTGGTPVLRIELKNETAGALPTNKHPLCKKIALTLEKSGGTGGCMIHRSLISAKKSGPVAGNKNHVPLSSILNEN